MSTGQSNGFGTLASLGLGTGMDIQGLVDKLVDKQGKYKTDNLKKRETTTNAKISGYAVLKKALADFQVATKPFKYSSACQNKKATIVNDPSVDADATYFTATATSAASTNCQFTVEVEQLAKAHKFTSAIYTGEDVHFSTGSLKITVGYGQDDSHAFIVPITAPTEDSPNTDTLAGIKDAINVSGTGLGVSATILTSDAGARLIVSSNNTGVENTLYIEVFSDDGGDSPTLTELTAGLSETVAAQDAQVKVDGNLVTSASNRLASSITGVTLDLLKAEDGKEHSLTITSDQQATKNYVKELVAKYNELVEKIKDLTKTDVKVLDQKGDKKSSTSKDKKDSNTTVKKNNGELQNEQVVKTLLYTLRNGLTSTRIDPSGINCLQAIGIASNRTTGKLEINETRLDTVIASDPDAVVRMLSDSEDGIGGAMYDIATNYLQGSIVNGVSYSSPIKLKVENLQGELKRIEVEKLKNARSLLSLETRYLKQLSFMDQTVGKLNMTTAEIMKKLDNSFVEPGKYNK